MDRQLAPPPPSLSPVQGGGSPREDEEVLKGLTPAALKFSELFAVNGNVRKSSMLAGCHPDYGHQLLKRPGVQRAIEYFRALYLEQSLYTELKLLRQWGLMASVNLTEYLDDDYALKPLSQLTEEQRTHLGVALVGIDVVEKAGRRVAKPKFAKVEALENLGKLMHLYREELGSGGEGLTLNIALGTQVHVEASEGVDEDVGPFRVRLPGMAAGEG